MGKNKEKKEENKGNRRKKWKMKKKGEKEVKMVQKKSSSQPFWRSFTQKSCPKCPNLLLKDSMNPDLYLRKADSRYWIFA